MSDAANASAGAHSLDGAADRLRPRWGEIVAFGALLTALGAVAVAFAFATAVGAVTLNGVFFLVAGLAEIGVGAHTLSWGRLLCWTIGGALYLVAGVLCIINPIFASLALTLALGASLIAAGALRAYRAFQLPADYARSMVLLAAAVTFLLGLIIVMRWPTDSRYALGVLLGVDLLFHGAGWMTFGIGLSRRR